MHVAKVLYIGLSRSGTTSLNHVLSELGLKSVHFCGFLLSDLPNWEKCGEFDALGDSPIPSLYKELDRRFPGSKFILTIREKESWLKSMEWMFDQGKMIFNWNERIHEYHEHFYGTRSYNEDILSMHWENYHRDVFKYFSDRPNDLLTIKLEDGFIVDEICSFLDLPYSEIPNVKMNTKRKAKLRSYLKYNAKSALRRLLQFIR
ncbi:MAG: hypothetical protein HOI15_01960 [Opitutales bacterium]|jgi:hypothetical protein|nr:hypothetical protein [Opitutales bacterium]